MFSFASVEWTFVAGSKTVRPEAEKSPARMRSVATLAKPGRVFSSRRVSELERKNNLSRLSLAAVRINVATKGGTNQIHGTVCHSRSEPSNFLSYLSNCVELVKLLADKGANPHLPRARTPPSRRPSILLR